MTDNRNKILGFMRRKLEWLESLPENACRAELAELRRGIGHAPGDIPTLWGTFLTDLPEEFYRNDGEASEAEWAVYIALTMFALHQQGHDFKSDWMHADKIPFGRAVRKLAPVADDTNDDLKRIRNRFNKIATASDMRELASHLRGMVNLLSSNDIKFDYADLAYDLYRYNFSESRSKVRLKWGQHFCHVEKTEEKSEQ